ncbi:MAG: c-type cytochrome [Chloroflexota bacterium]
MRFKMMLTALTAILLLTACGGTSEPEIPVSEAVASLPEGDATRGETIHNEGSGNAANCASCHSLDGSDMAGPTFQGYSEIAGTRVEELTAEEYTYQSIVSPASHIVSGYSNLMPRSYEARLSEQDLADLMAFLLTQ